MNTLLGEPIGQTWLQLVELGLAFLLSALIGLEREIRQNLYARRLFLGTHCTHL
jgi:putative Mg2+ transporter-C (MgtC) family protein